LHQQDILFAVKRDIPDIRQDLDDLTKDCNAMSDSMIELNRQHDRLVEQMKSLSEKVSDYNKSATEGFVSMASRLDSLSRDIKGISDKEEKPWYQNFEKVMIFVLILGLGTLAGVKSYNDVIGFAVKAVSPIPSAPVPAEVLETSIEN